MTMAELFDTAYSAPFVGKAPIVRVSELDEEDEDESGGNYNWADDNEELEKIQKQQQQIEEQRDDLEELQDFQSLLMPAARESAAKRLNFWNSRPATGAAVASPLSRRHNNQQFRCENAVNPMATLNTAMAKFPVIDEDLFVLAAANGITKNSNGSAGRRVATPPPANLCRLITNVSECRWTTKKSVVQPSNTTHSFTPGILMSVPSSTSSPSSLGQVLSSSTLNMLFPTAAGGTLNTIGINDGGSFVNGEDEMPKFVMRRPLPMTATTASTSKAENKVLKRSASPAPLSCLAVPSPAGPSHTSSKNDSDAAIRRLSALSMVSSVSSYGGGGGGPLDDASNCDCTSLAMAAFRSNKAALAEKRRKRILQRQNKAGAIDASGKRLSAAVDDDSYRKVSTTHSKSNSSLLVDSPPNDSGISTSSSSDSSSRSTSLSAATAVDGRRGTTATIGASNATKVCPVPLRNCCSNCGRQFLPPAPDGGRHLHCSSKQSLSLLSRRKRAFNYLFGNWMLRFLQQDKKEVEMRRKNVEDDKLDGCRNCSSALSTRQTTAVDLKLMGQNGKTKAEIMKEVVNDINLQHIKMNMPVPVINIEMVQPDNEMGQRQKEEEKIEVLKGMRRMSRDLN